jgi:CheY-like chemotaxis protein
VKLDDDVVHDKVTVRDTGCGMKPDYIPKMFEPFSQERQTADTEGSGLGLSIVKKLVDLMGGRIEVNSEPGRGTEFTVWLDIKRAQLPPKAPEQVSGGGGELRGRRVLLAEDNAMNTEIARAILASRGIETVCAENGSEACRIFAASAPGEIDAVLMDIRMPVMNGYDAARAIRAMDRPDAASVPIVAMSADAFDDDIRACLDAGMNGHVAKPIVPELLFEKLSDAMGKRTV